MNDFLNSVNIILGSIDFKIFILPMKIAFFTLSGILLFFIIYAFFKTSYIKTIFGQDLAEFLAFRPFGIKKMTKEWDKITEKLESAAESDHRVAIIEADNMLDDILKKMGYKEKTLEEKLDNLNKVVLPSLHEIEVVHKVRNEIVFNPDYRLEAGEARRVLDIYEKALRELEVF